MTFLPASPLTETGITSPTTSVVVSGYQNFEEAWLGGEPGEAGLDLVEGAALGEVPGVHEDVS
jgi:hypothetical protein